MDETWIEASSTSPEREYRQTLRAITHDLRAPMRAIDGFADALFEDFDGQFPEEAGDLLRRIRRSVDRLATLLGEVDRYQRVLEADPHLTGVSLRHALDDVLESLQGEIERRTAVVDAPETMPRVLGSHSLVTLMLEELVQNALKFVPADRTPHVRIWTQERDGQVELFVEDNGVGFPNGPDASIFDVFERLHSIEQAPGTGIGLAIVAKSSEKLGGTLKVRVAPTTGACFCATFLVPPSP